MHEQCAIDDALSRTYQRRLGGEGAIDGTNKETKKGRRKSKKAKATKNVWDGLFEAKIVPRQAEDAVEKANTIEDGTGEGDADRDESTKDTRMDVEEEAQESQTDNREPKESAGKLVITDLRDEEQKTWEEDIVCIGCHRKVK